MEKLFHAPFRRKHRVVRQRRRWVFWHQQSVKTAESVSRFRPILHNWSIVQLNSSISSRGVCFLFCLIACFHKRPHTVCVRSRCYLVQKCHPKYPQNTRNSKTHVITCDRCHPVGFYMLSYLFHTKMLQKHIFDM